MAELNDPRIEQASSLLDPKSALFARCFPEISPGVLVRPLTDEERRQRAMTTMWACAKKAATWLGADDRDLVGDIVFTTLRRGVMRKFDPALGTFEGFMVGVMKRIGLECLRARRQRRWEAPTNDAVPFSAEVEPATAAERAELVAHIRQGAMGLSQVRRDALAREYEALADLDSGGPVPNEAVQRHRGLEQLRKRARQLDNGALCARKTRPTRQVTVAENQVACHENTSPPARSEGGVR